MPCQKIASSPTAVTNEFFRRALQAIRIQMQQSPYETKKYSSLTRIHQHFRLRFSAPAPAPMAK